MTSAPVLDLTGPLFAGPLVIEASAGTGKTFTLAALATRFVAEQDVHAAQLLVVTFTRAATTELRARIRDRLVEAAEVLATVDAVMPPDYVLPPIPGVGVLDGRLDSLLADPLLRHLAGTDRLRRAERLQQAVSEFDAATITTIHGFAAQALGASGNSADIDLDATLVDDTDELLAEVCADVLAAAAMGEYRRDELPTPAILAKRVRIASNTPDLLIVPGDDDEARPADRFLGRLVRQSLEEMRRRRRAAGVMGFDDLLLAVRAALTGPRRDAVIQFLRGRFRAALIDEFQDTDRVQWEVMKTLFAETERTTLVLVGDPKQAIYSFRGANVAVYTDAVGAIANRRALETNWRSDGAALRALDLLFEGCTFGDSIGFTPVEAAPTNVGRRLLGPGGKELPALALRLAPASPEDKPKPVDSAFSDVLADLVSQVASLLRDGSLPGESPSDPERPGTGRRPVGPSDIAVLVRTNREAEEVQQALADRAIPAVLARGGSVLESPAADQWRWLLEALLRPSDARRARLFALSWFGGRTAGQVAALPDEELGGIQEELHSWAELLTSKGVVEFVRRVVADSGVVPRVLALPDGDRALTDLGHVGELLQAGAADFAGVAGLLAVLNAERPEMTDAESGFDPAARRIESDVAAVQIMTIWVSKGLEFSIVCCPTLWRKGENAPTIYPVPGNGRQAFDVARADWPDAAEAALRRAPAVREDRGENLRLLYVALTRARHQTIVWWAKALGSEQTALACVLFGEPRGAGATEAFLSGVPVAVSHNDDPMTRLGLLVGESGGAISATTMVEIPPIPRWDGSSGEPPGGELRVAAFDRHLDRSARRWSFTAIAGRDHGTPVDPHDSSQADRGAADEGVAGEDALPPEESDDSRPVEVSGSGLALLPAGAAFGTLVHSVLEEVDPTGSDLDGQLRHVVTRQAAGREALLRPVGTVEEADGAALLAEGLAAVLDTSLGPLVGDLRLRDFGPADRLAELSFELLLGQGGLRATDRDIGRLVVGHLPDVDPLRRWAEELAAGRFGVDLAGHLTGSIDAVLRVRGLPDRYVVVDYKTNRLHRPGRLVGPDDYSPGRMAAAMAEHHYPLQALLYLVALHRYLRWRLRGYDPEANLGGAAYLFVRGMTGPATPATLGSPHGVYGWFVPPALVVELSDLLAGASVESGSAAPGSPAGDPASSVPFPTANSASPGQGAHR